MNISHISVSRKKTWDTCKQQYKYRYHLEVPVEGESPFYFTYGKIVHKIAEEYVLCKNKPLNEITQSVLNGEIEIEKGVKAPPLPADYKKRLPVNLVNLKKIIDRTGFSGEVEYEFYHDLDPPHGRHIKGFIDRLILGKNTAHIIDYKTTRKGPWRVNKRTVKKDLQLRAYARIVQRDFNIKAENILAGLYYLEDGELVAARFSEKSLIRAEQELLEAYKQIEEYAPDLVRGNVGDHCRRCDYRPRCPFYSLT